MIQVAVVHREGNLSSLVECLWGGERSVRVHLLQVQGLHLYARFVFYVSRGIRKKL